MDGSPLEAFSIRNVSPSAKNVSGIATPCRRSKRDGACPIACFPSVMILATLWSELYNRGDLISNCCRRCRRDCEVMDDIFVLESDAPVMYNVRTLRRNVVFHRWRSSCAECAFAPHTAANEVYGNCSTLLIPSQSIAIDRSPQKFVLDCVSSRRRILKLRAYSWVILEEHLVHHFLKNLLDMKTSLFSLFEE